MIGVLPTKLKIGGKLYDIRSDYREILNIYQAFEDKDLTDMQKAYICMKCLYVSFESIPEQHMQEAVNKAYWFCDGGDIPKSEPAKIKTLDWEHDESIIFPAVNKVAGYEVRSCEYMHWWSFLGMFGEIGEGLFSTVMSLRQKKAEGKKLEKWERSFYKKNKNLVNIMSEENQEDIKATEEFLNTLI